MKHFSQHWVIQSIGDSGFRFHLLNPALIFFGIVDDHVFEGQELAGLGVFGRINLAERTFSDHRQDRVTINLFRKLRHGGRHRQGGHKSSIRRSDQNPNGKSTCFLNLVPMEGPNSVDTGLLADFSEKFSSVQHRVLSDFAIHIGRRNVEFFA